MHSLKNMMYAVWSPARDGTFHMVEAIMFVMHALLIGIGLWEGVVALPLKFSYVRDLRRVNYVAYYYPKPCPSLGTQDSLIFPQEEDHGRTR
jgi:hypothetical protein